ncbi:MAG TPA: phosphatidylglycerophosphatase A [Actinomycetota bacterium]|nr:phosphatidylglycerophosphatase A [Actinomycetota bacterium]
MSLARRVATVGLVGYWPWGPGTLASALVGLLWWTVSLPRWIWLTAVAVLTVVGIAAAGQAERDLGRDDGRIVIDEVVGMGLALVAVSHTLAGTGLAFALFRAFDILKPPPVAHLQRLPRGWGVVGDDLAAGALAAGGGWLVTGLW